MLKFLVAVLLIQSASSAQTLPPWLEMFPTGVYQSKEKREFNFFASTPKGKPIRANPPSCSAKELESVVTRAESPKEQSQAAAEFFERCRKTLTRFSPTKLGAILRSPAYSIKGRKDLWEVRLQLPLGVKIRGLLAMKPSSRPRPWVIAICGTACDLDDNFARLPIATFFDESPFNVLVLQSATGKGFIRENGILEIGGFLEGRQVFEVARLLAGQDSPFRESISSFHIVGGSLGGNSALFTSVYASMNPFESDLPKIQSVMGYCPAIDIRKSVEDLDRNSYVGRHYRKEILAQTREAVLKSPMLYSQLQEKFEIQTNSAIDFVYQWSLPGFQEMISREGFLIPPFLALKTNPESFFWDVNNFNNFSHFVTVPTYVIASENDFVLKASSNARALERKLLENPNPSLSVFLEKKGWHCQMTQVFGTDIFGALFRSLILRNSPEFNRESRSLNLATFVNLKSLDEGELYFGYHWSINSKSKFAGLKIQVWSPEKRVGNSKCASWSPYYAFEGCFRYIHAEVPLSTFFGDSLPDYSSGAGVAALSRWLNSRVQLLNELGQEPVETRSKPVVMTWKPD